MVVVAVLGVPDVCKNESVRMQTENIKTGRVTRLHDHYAMVQVDHALTCSGADPGCPYNSMYFGVITPQTIEVEAENLVQAEVGDWVRVALPSRQVTQAVTWTYGTALTLFFLGLGLGALLADWLPLIPELTMTLSGLGALILSIILIHQLDKRYQPHYRIIQILQAEDFYEKQLHPGVHSDRNGGN